MENGEILIVSPQEYCLNESLKYLGVRESGFNKGKQVEEFQKAVDGKASGEAWCMAFVQYCVKHACHDFGYKQVMYSSEHCMTTWRKTKDEHKWIVISGTIQNVATKQIIGRPLPGMVIIWNHEGSDRGHTGFYKEMFGKYMVTIEGNTGASDSIGKITSEGDGVYCKKRNYGHSGTMKLVGFINPCV